MGKKKKATKPGFGKLLDAWVAPDDAGEAVGCIATSFTFSPAFFEEECLARFLQLESDPTEDGPVYLVEREDKLARVACASALVDQRHCRGGRSLRWDLLTARMQGLQHAKVSLLVWSNLVRVIIGSANLTDDGYRRNLEVFGVLDYRVAGHSPLSCLNDTIAFLRRGGQYGNSGDGQSNPALTRWNGLLDRVERKCSSWGMTDDELRRNGVRVQTVFSGPELASVFDSLSSCWPGGSPPDEAHVVSPFFDPPEVPSMPAERLWGLLRQRGDAAVNYHVTAEDVVGEDTLLLHAPKSLLHATPKGRGSVSSRFYRVLQPDGRPLHAKGIWLQSDRWRIYQIGSSNFTGAGTGISKKPNLEANLVYIVDKKRDAAAARLLDSTFPDSESVNLDNVKWTPLRGDQEDPAGLELLLAGFFGDATYHCDREQHASVTLSFCGELSAGWQLVTDGDEEVFFDSKQWQALGDPASCTLDWTQPRPPSGFWVRCDGSDGLAWWPVNVTAGNVLPPPEELKNLPLEVLIDILSSARPLHRVLGPYLKRKHKAKSPDNVVSVVDPHKRVDTSQFILQRTRRLSWALGAIRERLERPVATIEFLQWRLRGPVGVIALAEALVREARSEEEKAFLISELALELARTQPTSAEGYVPVAEHKAEIRQVISELRGFLPADAIEGPENLRQYVESVFQPVST